MITVGCWTWCWS